MSAFLCNPSVSISADTHSTGISCYLLEAVAEDIGKSDWFRQFTHFETEN